MFSLDDFDADELLRAIQEFAARRHEIIRRAMYGGSKGEMEPPRQSYGKPVFDVAADALRRYDELINRSAVDFFANDARPKPYSEEQARQAERHERAIQAAAIDGGE